MTNLRVSPTFIEDNNFLSNLSWTSSYPEPKVKEDLGWRSFHSRDDDGEDNGK